MALPPIFSHVTTNMVAVEQTNEISGYNGGE
jgi:hypothetical protein